MTVPSLFVAVHGQDDNVGDPALRRAMLEGLGEGHRRHVLTGPASHAYVSGLGLRGDDILYTTRREWQLAAFRGAARGGAAFVSNAGEIQLNARRRAINRADLSLAGLIRARDGVVMLTGIGIRDPSGPRSRMLGTLSRLSALSAWRDEPTRRYVGHGTVAPDWAFALGNPSILHGVGEASPSQRTSLVISMRGDRPHPGDDWHRVVKATASALGLRITVVTQVERDLRRSAELVSALDGDEVPWRSGDHRGLEEVLRNVYRSASLVVSDRLHVLIFAATEGAVPASLVESPSLKIPRTLEAAGLTGHEVPMSGRERRDVIADFVSLVARREQTADAVRAAHHASHQLKSQMNRLLAI